MTNEEFNVIGHELLSYIKDRTPKDTGNLAYNATGFGLGVGTFTITVNTKIAPYFKYVNNYETFTRKYKNGNERTVQNRNYHYFEKAVDSGVEYLAQLLGGTLIK